MRNVSFLSLFSDIRNSFVVVVGAIALWGCTGKPALESTQDLQRVNIDDPVVAENVQKYQALVNADPNDAQALGNLGLVFELHGFYEAALETYREVALRDPQNPRWPYYEALLLARRVDKAQALERINTSLALDPYYGPAWLWRGTWLLSLAMPTEALQAFNRARNLGSQTPAQVGIARADLLLGNTNSAVQRLEQLEERVDIPYVTQLLGQAYLRDGQLEKAKAILDEHFGASPPPWRDPWLEAKQQFFVQDLTSQIRRVELLILDKGFEEAKQVLASMKKTYPDSRTVLTQLIEVYGGLGMNEEATGILVEGLSKFPNYYPFHMHAADAAYGKSELDKALHHADRAIEIDPNISAAFELKARVLLDQTRWQTAHETVQKSLEINANNVSARVIAGIALSRLQRWGEAVDELALAHRLESTYQPTYPYLIVALTALCRLDEAKTMLAHAVVQKVPTDQLAKAEEQFNSNRCTSE